MSNQQLTTTATAAIVHPENIDAIVQAAPQSYQANAISCHRCVEAGNELLREAQSVGMSDDLDRRIASFIGKSRKTVKVMNERRAPVTKLFDQIRAEFTVLENDIDPTKKDTVPAQLQQLRNTYAAKKLQEEEQRRRAAEAERLLSQARADYRAACEEDYRASFNRTLNGEINRLAQLDASVTLDNIDAVRDTVAGTAVTLPDGWMPRSNVRIPANIAPQEAVTISSAVFSVLRPKFEEQYTWEVGDYRQEILDKLPSKKTELERIAQADAAEAERLKADIARREAEEAARKEKERIEKERLEKEAAELKRQNSEMDGLFGANVAEAVYAPKTKVSKKIVVSQPAAFLNIVSMWWQYEGSALSVDELAKIFKKQVTACEKTANQKEIFIDCEGLEYIDDVKAK